jgi:hypothetical protein
MRKNLIITLFVLSVINVTAQTKLESKKIYTGKYATEKSAINTYEDCIPYNDELLLLNYDAGLAYRVYFNSLAPQIVLNSYSIDRVDPTTKKMKNIPILQDFQGLDVSYYDYLLKGNNLKTFFGYYNKKKKTKYIFCNDLDLTTNKSKTTKIFENKIKGSGIKTSYMKVIANHEDNKIAMIDLNNTGKVTFDYVIKDFDLNIIDFGEKISAADTKDADITNFTLTKGGEIVFNVLKKEAKGGLFKSAKYSDKVMIIKDSKIKDINMEVAKYIGNVKLIKGNDNEARVLMSYSDVQGKYEGIYLANIDAQNGELVNKNKITYESLEFANDKRTEKQQIRKAKTDKGDAGSTENIITDISIAPNGDIYLLQEIRRVSTQTTSSTSRGVTTYTTRTYYNYGPGVVHCIDPKTNENKGYVKIDYRFSSTVDMGQGLNYVPSNDKKIWVSKAGDYYTYKLDNSTKSYFSGGGDKRASVGAAYKNLFMSKAKRNLTSLFTLKDKAYSISKTSQRVSIGEIKLD